MSPSSTRIFLRSSIIGVLSLLCFMLLTTSAVFAQGTRGNIRGTVADPNGAVIAGANVKLILVARQQEIRSLQTDEGGNYQFLELEPATYTIVITATGFAETRLTDVIVDPNRNLQLDTKLSVGGAAAEVTVTGTQELIDRETPTLGTTVDARRVIGLPLNGRNILDLALLQPGITTTAGGAIRSNGARAVENNFQLDGSNNNEIAVGGQTGAQPRPDSVQEFRLLTSNYEAEFGRNSGSVINVVTKSGTNDFHGNLRAFYRPTVLSAARFFDQNAGQKPRAGTVDDFRRRFERKEFGGNIGGPIYLPHFGEGGRSLISGKNKAFFFVDYEGRRQLIGSTVTLSGLPSAEEKLGIFTRTAGQPLLYDPATAAPFPIISSSGGVTKQQIPASRFSPIGQYYIGFIPTGNAAGNATVGAPEVSNFDQLTFRVDPWNTDRQTLGFTFSRFNIATQSPFPFFPTTNGANVPGFASVDLRKTYNAALRHTFTFSPTLVNSFLAGYARNGQPSLAPVNKTTPAQIGFTANFVASPASAGPPFIFLDDRTIRLGNTFQGPQTRYTSNFQLQDSLSWARGDHRFKFGADGTKYLGDTAFLFINQAIIGYGRFEDANTTGDDLADLMIGNSPGYIQFGSNGERDFRQWGGALFAQDTWRATDQLTLSLGLRYEYVGPLSDAQNRVAYYRPTAAAQGISSTLLSTGQLKDSFGRAITVPAGRRAPIGLLYPGDPDPDLGGLVPNGGVNRDLNNFAPRIGFAYSPRVKEGSFLHRLMGEQQTVIRGGVGVFYGAIVGDTALQQLTANGYQGTNAYFEEVGGTLANPFGPDPFPNYGNSVGNGFGVCNPANFGPNCGTDLTQPTIPNPFLTSGAEQVGVALATRNTSGATVRIANTSRAIDPFIRTPYTFQYNLTFQRSFLKNYVVSVGYVGNRGYKLYAIEQVNYAYGVPGFFPYPASIPAAQQFAPTTAGTNVNGRRINTDFGLGISQQVAKGNSWYNSLQVDVTRRYANGLLFQVAYTFSKSITDTAGTDTNRGSLDAINRNFGKSLSADDVPHRLVASFVYDLPLAKTFGFNSGVLHTLFDGWGIGGIYTAESGRLFFVNNVSNTTGTGGGVISLADLGDPFTPLDPRTNNLLAFNKAAFKNATLACGTLACARRGSSGVNQFRASNGINNWDLIVSKKTRLWSETSGLELRFEAFNALNHTQFTTLNLNLSDPNFGKFSAARESRVIQLGARFSF